MDFNEYQEKTNETAVWPKMLGEDFVYPLLGLVGEAGEVAEKVKKIFRDDNGVVTAEKREEITKELGDVLWYTAQLAVSLDIKLNDVAEGNIKKTHGRKERRVMGGSGDNR